MCVSVSVSVRTLQRKMAFLINEGGSGLMGPFVETFFTERDGSGQCHKYLFKTVSNIILFKIL